MRRILNMVRKDLLRQLRSPMTVLVLLAFPVVFSSLLGLAFGTGDVAPPRVRLLVEDRDQTFLSGLLAGVFDSDQASEYFDTTRVGAEGVALMESGDASALLRIPEGFSADLLEGRPVTLALIRNPAESILPEIAEQSMTVLADILSAGSRLLREPLDRMAPMLSAEEAPSADEVARLSVRFYDTIRGSQQYLIPPAITMESVQLQGDGSESSGSSPLSVFLWVLPGVSVWALFAIGDAGMRDILTESGLGTLRRQLCAPLPAWQLVLGKALYSAVLALISLVILSAIGAIVIERPIDGLGFALLSLAIILAVTGFASVIYGFARTPGQGATFASILLLVFAFVGGSFIPLDSLPGSVRALAPFTPFYWGTSGYQALIRDAARWTGILPNVGVLTGLGLALLATGSAVLGRRVRRGHAA